MLVNVIQNGLKLKAIHWQPGKYVQNIPAIKDLISAALLTANIK